MAENNDLIRKIRAGKFKENNGRVMRTINILRIGYMPFTDIRLALSDLDEGDLLDCIHYLQEKGYIRLRYRKTREIVELADVSNYDLLELKLTGEGIDLMGGEIINNMIIV